MKESGKKKKNVFVALSGGVDSSVAAALLKERGFCVRGIHIKMWSDPAIPCSFKHDREDAMRVAARLGIPFETWDFTEEFRRDVVEYLVREYAAGKTPNPDIMCNRHIKFGVFLARALECGADYIATGHYVRKSESQNFTSETNSKSHIPIKLLQARDTNKDQSYFLWTLTQHELAHSLFPIGEYTKLEVRARARALGLPTAEKKESQGICFIGEIDLAEFLKRRIPLSRGSIVTVSGNVVGEHEGLSFYTIGQREGLGVGGGIPYYVAAKDFRRNALIVAEGPYDTALFRREVRATDVQWVSGVAPEFPLACEARIRYRQPLQSCTVNAFDELHTSTRRGIHQFINSPNRQLAVIFREPQRAVTPGQSIVLYRGEEVLGGGFIADGE